MKWRRRVEEGMEDFERDLKFIRPGRWRKIMLPERSKPEREGEEG